MVSEMFDNPLYGSMAKSHGRGKDQEHSQRDHLTPPDHMFGAPKAADRDPERPPIPTPRNRSFTCSENRLQPPSGATSSSSMHKKPVVPSRSEGGMGHSSRPPLPSKFPQTPKSRDYRESSEIPVKHRPPARPGQPQPHRDSKENLLSFPLIKSLITDLMHTLVLLQHIPKSRRLSDP